MSIPSKSRTVKTRAYKSDRRAAQAAGTRRDIVEAARRLFESDGYAATTMSAIAKEAGVAIETIYRSFEGKARLIQAVVEAAVAGGAGRAEVPPEERPAIRSLIEEPDPRTKLGLYAATQPGIHQRAGRLRRPLRKAATADPDLRPVLDRLESQPLLGMARFAQHLEENGALRSDITVEEARDVLWAINSLSVYELLVVERGWSEDRYQTWITSMMIQSLLEPN